jgi:hypothetical protein
VYGYCGCFLSHLSAVRFCAALFFFSCSSACALS